MDKQNCLKSWGKPPPLFHKMDCKWKVWVKLKNERKTDRGWQERWLTWNVNVCGVKMLMDWAGLSPLYVWEREEMVYAIVFAHIPSFVCVCVSVCMSTSKHMHMHVCVCTESDALSQSRLIAPWWAITGRLDRFIKPIHLRKRHIYIKNACHFLKWFCAF